MSLDLLAPEARRWLTGPIPDGSRVVVAGVAGGVGTTTVAALLARTLGATVTDHSGGSLAARVGVVDPTGGSLAARVGVVDPTGGSLAARAEDPTGGSPAARVGAAEASDVVVHDLGPHALATSGSALEDPDVVVVIVCASHARGLADARDALSALVPRTVNLEQRAILVPVAVSGSRHPANDPDLIRIPRSRALAAGDPLPGPARDLRVTRAAGVLAAEVVRRARWIALG
jgi:hypothetical protein